MVGGLLGDEKWVAMGCGWREHARVLARVLRARASAAFGDAMRGLHVLMLLLLLLVFKWVAGRI